MGFDTPAGEARLPYNGSGMVPALRRPEITLAGLKLQNLYLLGIKATLGVQLDATNLGGKTIDFKGFEYRLKLGAERVANGVVQRLGDVQGNGTDRLLLPVELTLTSLGAGVLNAIKNRGDVNAQLTASLKVGTPFGDVPLSIDESSRLGFR